MASIKSAKSIISTGQILIVDGNGDQHWFSNRMWKNVASGSPDDYVGGEIELEYHKDGDIMWNGEVFNGKPNEQGIVPRVADFSTLVLKANPSVLADAMVLRQDKLDAKMAEADNLRRKVRAERLAAANKGKVAPIPTE